eukprot:CAMPEP_0115208436 /NCGR_PEP_ID=MMETSP0270-20121206/21225_1 /TAXON_ID=71861 /ORGANISM="Scrippsiella trochoidea, Strain CCMP3099" /LENGTH=79 /DNA_ID=CAMNT_0002622049 /DNA_START=507 /DNA_END=747 /DNA_ORIENTATION=+
MGSGRATDGRKLPLDSLRDRLVDLKEAQTHAARLAIERAARELCQSQALEVLRPTRQTVSAAECNDARLAQAPDVGMCV